VDRSSGQKIQETAELNCTVEQMDLRDSYRTFYSMAAECTFFSLAHGTLSRIVHIIDHKTSLKELKRTEIILSVIFSDHNAIMLEINEKKNIGNYTTQK
jgi:exonuclease III